TGNDWDIFVMQADGSGRKQLTHDPGPQFDPSWSPDGKRIAYRDSRFGINNNDEIFVMNADSSGQTNLTHNPANEWSPAWSPDGTRLACEQEGQVAVMNASGSGQMTLGPGNFPAWTS